MKYLIAILTFIILYSFTGASGVYKPVILIRDTVPTGAAPQLFGSKLYEFRNYALIDSFLMVMAGDTSDIPRWPALKYKSSDNRWYGYHGTRWRAFLNGADTVSLSNRIGKIKDSTGIGVAYNDSTVIYNTGVGGVYDSTVYAYPGDTLQRKLETVPPYGRLMVMPGLHVMPLDTLNSVMYVDTSNITIEFAPGSYVKIQDFSNAVIDSVEINRNYGQQVGLNDIVAQTTIHPPNIQSIVVTITSTGTPNQYTVSGASSGNGIYNMTGSFQAIGTTGIEVNFAATTGHTLSDMWTLITSSTPASIIRVGQGFQDSTIRNTNIIGHGVLDGNATNQHPVNGQAAESNYTVGVFGRVNNTTIRDITIVNSERSIFASGRTTGTFNTNGTVTGGASYDVNGLRILGVNSYDNTSGFLFGHPSYRGFTKNVFMMGCNVVNNSSLATVEPNLFCDSFIITNNYIENSTGGSSLHLWRAPSNGKIFNNIIRGTTGDNAPSGWYRSFGLNNWADYDNNLFSLSQQNAINGANNGNRIGVGTTSPSTKFQVVGPHVSGQGLLNVRGSGNLGFVIANTTAAGTAGFSLQSANGPVASFQGVGSDTTGRLFNDRFSCCPIISLYNNGSLNVGIPGAKPTVKLQVRDTVSIGVTNTIRNIAKYMYKWSGATPTPFAGLGIGIDFDVTNGTSGSDPKTVARIEIPYTDGTNGSEDADVILKNIRAGTLTEGLRITSNGITVNGKVIINTVDSAASPANMLWIDPNTKEVKKAAVPADGNGIYGGSGSLSGPTTVTGGANTLTLTGTQSSSSALIIQNTGNGVALSMSTTGSGPAGIISNTGTGEGLQITANGGTGLNVTSVSSTAGSFNINPSTTNTTEKVVNFNRRTTGTAANNIGVGAGFQLEDDAGLTYEAAQIKAVATDATSASRTTSFLISTVENATPNDRFSILGSGETRLHAYGAGTFTGTPTGSIQTTSNGSLIEGPIIAAGAYTPTLTSVANVDASTAFSCQYMRIGSTVTVSGRIDIDPTAAGATTLGISLPIASALANNNECGGTGSVGTAEGLQGAISADPANDRVQLDFVIPAAGSLVNNSWFFSFSYRIL